MSGPRMSLPRLLLRWLIGMTLVSWRYMWLITPLHRSEVEGSRAEHTPPDLPAGVTQEGLLHHDDGAGPLFHRRFRVRITDAELDPRALMRLVVDEFDRFVPREVVGVHEPPSRRAASLARDDEFEIDMPGPWNGPVRVLVVDGDRLRLGTLPGHLEAGQIEFHAHAEDGQTVFEIESWARPSTRAVDLLYTRVRLAKEIQLNMWVRFCSSVAKAAKGRVAHGIEITTYRCPT